MSSSATQASSPTQDFAEPAAATAGDFAVLQRQSFAAVLFDVDGTLVNSVPVVDASWGQWCEEYGLQFADLGVFQGIPSKDTVRKHIHEGWQAALDRINQIELSRAFEPIALPGAIDALFASNPYAAIVTSASRALFAGRAVGADLPLPPVVVTSDDVVNGKPDPEPFLLAARRLGVDATKCLVIEDAVSGLTGARAAGMSTLGLSTTYDAAMLPADAVQPDLSYVRFSVDDGLVRLALA